MIDEINKWASKLNFNNIDDYNTHPFSEIRCPQCNEIVNINFKDLNKHKDSQHSNLNQKDNKTLTRIVVDSAPALSYSFLDYYCPKCNSPIRILYNYYAGGRHTEFGFNLKYIIYNMIHGTHNAEADERS